MIKPLTFLRYVSIELKWASSFDKQKEANFYCKLTKTSYFIGFLRSIYFTAFSSLLFFFFSTYLLSFCDNNKNRKTKFFLLFFFLFTLFILFFYWLNIILFSWTMDLLDFFSHLTLITNKRITTVTKPTNTFCSWLLY